MIGKKRFAAIGMTVMLTAFTLAMSGCSTDTASKAVDDSTGSASVEWEYVAPSDLKGDTAKADSEASDAQQDSDSADAQQESSNADAQQSDDSQSNGEAPSGQPPEMPNGDSQSSGAPNGMP